MPKVSNLGKVVHSVNLRKEKFVSQILIPELPFFPLIYVILANYLPHLVFSFVN